MTIYFLSDGEYIKIGYTKQDVYNRINNLQTANARDLICMGDIPGNLEDERKLYNKFQHLRVRGEWFRRERELIEYIKGITDNNAFYIILDNAHKRHSNYPRELFTITFRLDDDEPYVSVEHYPGGWLGAMYDGIGCCLIDGHSYIRLGAVESERNQVYEKIRALHKDGLKKLQDVYFPNQNKS